MELVVYVDFGSPQARLALNPTRRLAKETGIALDWRPMSRKPRPHRTGDTRSKGARHARIRAEYRRREESFYAEQQGLSLVYPDAKRESFAANAGLAWLRRQHGPFEPEIDAYVAGVFERVWRGAMDPFDRKAVRAAIAAEHGFAEGLDAWFDEQAEAHLESYRQQALEQGVVDVPGYVLNGEPFVGRANLPIIRSLLADGRITA